ncbi:hypothetical protein ACJMK2_000504 [Sinanodonta woodiana]|uniref:Ig-like domain-containing protein n=1 Tax=Sinanodonta woodiana TaxID=1069815 RepID=A0ABD3XPK0_SINWO
MRFVSLLIGCAIIVETFVTVAFPPNMLTTNFNTKYVKPGSSAQERCQAGGDPKPTYIWKKDGVVLSTDANYEINSVTGNITIKSVTALNGEGTYQCLAQNSQGTALSGLWEVKIAGAVPPNMLTTNFNTKYVMPFSVAHEKCQAGGDPKPTYVWKKDGVVLTTDASYEINSITGNITIRSVTALNGEGTYQCFAQNSQGTALSGFWEVKIAVLHRFKYGKKSSSQPENEYSYFSMPCNYQPYSVPASKLDWLVGAGDNTTFPTTPEDKHRIVIDADGNGIVFPVPDVEWHKDGVKLPDGSSLPGGNPRYLLDPEDPTGRKLIISKLDIMDEGAYICRATNLYGTNEGNVKVTVTGPPQWNLERLRSTRVPVGSTATFRCDTVSYHATSSLPMWMKNGEPMIGCGMKKLWCGDGTRCYDYNKKCDGTSDCPGSPSADEQNCPALETCGEGQFSCGGGECKPAAEVIRCDGTPQCKNGGDESVRHCGCKVNTDFMCADMKSCVPASQRCNKHADCADGSDEKSCGYDLEKVIDNKFHFSADLKQLTIPNVKKIDTMCLQCLVYNFREYGPNPKPDIVGITFGDACLTVLDPINILTGFPDKQKVQPGDIINFTISAQTDPLEQGNLRYDWYIGGKKYPDQFPSGIWSQIIKLNMGNMHIVIDTSTLTSLDDRQFLDLMGNQSVRVYHEFDQRTISTELYTVIIYPPPPKVKIAEFNLWYIALIIGILILFVIVALSVCYLHRNRGGNYPVNKAGHDLEQELEDNGFYNVVIE